MTNSPVSITIAPVGFTADTGQTVAIKVTDNGQQRITVTGVSTQVRASGGNKCMLTLANNSLGFSPGRFTLAGGKSLRVSVKVDHGYAGEHLAALFYANAGNSGNGRISAGVGAQIAIKTGTINCSGSNALPANGGGGIPLALPILGVVFALITISGILLKRQGYKLRQRRYRGRHN